MFIYIMISKYVNFKIFFISFAIGLFGIYITGQDIKIIHVYPKPENVNNIQYKDKADQCFEFSANEVKCPLIPFMTQTIPIQT